MSESPDSLDPNYTGEGLTDEQEIYKENILDHYKNPHNKRCIEPCDIRHREHNPVCGDQIEVFVRLDGSIVADASFDGHGCAISQASVSMLTDRIKGMTIDAMMAVTREDILEMLGIPIGIVRQKCALLSLKTLHKGVDEWTEKTRTA